MGIQHRGLSPQQTMKFRKPSLKNTRLDRKRLVLFLLSFSAVVGLQTVLYWWGMRAIENEPRSLLESFGIVIQSLTTTGYGQDDAFRSIVDDDFTSSGNEDIIVVGTHDAVTEFSAKYTS